MKGDAKILLLPASSPVKSFSVVIYSFIWLPSVIKTSSPCEGGGGGQHLQQTYFN